ncbi:hypothetical protein BDQ12DRAFT_677193 [Crucibulum laeve]|uniref:Uncharacterized protein n=1 Tax=Crucibulum laeve TaxID=68775 RepID=A0A5C3MGJ3_9AGAR|nr:hypothetical protein BDQ12DRAFT_677193 [Crucibulum laeve]
MSHFSGDGASRPGIRRKSSAQNLLSSFGKSSNSPSPGPSVPPPINTVASNVASSSGLSFASVTTPTAAMTPLTRDYDAQSLHSDTAMAGATSPQLGQGPSVEYLRDLVQKRILTLTYIRNIHEGRSHWFHTILISRSELEKVFNNNDMKKRTYRFAILGLSLSNLLDINQPQDLLRGLLNTVTEYDQSKEENDKPKIRPSKRLFKPKIIKRGTSGVTEYTGSYVDTSADASYLTLPHMPFPLDYHQTLLSLLDVLSEVYNKISKMLGPSPFPHSSQHMAGPLGLLSPHPGVSYLFSGDSKEPPNPPVPSKNDIYSTSNLQPAPSAFPPSLGGTPDEMNGSLWGIANAGMGAGAGVGGAAGSFMYGGALGSPPPTSWTSSLGDMVIKVDGKLKKITSALLKDLDAFARNGIKDELATLDPLLRNMNVAGDGSSQTGGRITYDFEGM